MLQDSRMTDLTKINSTISDYANLFKDKLETNSESLTNFLNDISIPCLSETNLWKKGLPHKLTENDIYESMISFDNNKWPGINGLTKAFIRHTGKM